MTILHHTTFETFVTLHPNADPVPVLVEADILQEYRHGMHEIREVRVTRTENGAELVLDDAQMQDIYVEIHEQFEPDEPDADWRNEWDEP